MKYTIQLEHGWEVELDIDPNTPTNKEQKFFLTFEEAEQELNEILRRYPFLYGKVVEYK